MIRLPFLLIAISISSLVQAQPSYREGFIVNTAGDTSKGWIDYRQWERNPRAISFKKDVSVSQPTQFSVNDLNLFAINDADRYTRAVVKKDVRPVDLQSVSPADVDSTVIDTVFLRVLLEAKISLYELVDDKRHYYTKEEGGDYAELIYKVRVRDGSVQILPIFRNQLRNMFIIAGKTGNLESSLSRINYNESDLVKAIESINTLLHGETVTYKTTKVKQPVSFYVGAGMAYSTVNFSGPKDALANLDYTSSFTPLFTGGVDWYVGRNHQRLILRLDLAWYSLQYDGSDHRTIKDTLHYNLQLNNIAPGLSVMYNVINNPSGKLYVGAGFSYNLSSYAKNDLSRKYVLDGHVQRVSPYLDLEKSWISVAGKAGYLINKKFEIAVSTKLGGQFSNFTGMSLKPSIHTLNLNYHF